MFPDGDPLSTEEAVTEGYDSLEQRIFDMERDKDSEIRKDIRLRPWQSKQLNVIKKRMNASKVKVAQASYIEGLTKLRSIIDPDEIQEFNEFQLSASFVLFDSSNTTDSRSNIAEEDIEREIDHKPSYGGTVGKPRHLRIPDSLLSEVNEDYVEDGSFGSWIHRLIICLGFEMSDNLLGIADEYIQNIKQDIRETWHEAVWESEYTLKRFVSENLAFWIENGIEQKQLDHIQESYNLMKTEHKNEVETLMGILTSQAEVISED